MLFKSALRKKISFGKFGLPAWLVGIAGMVVVAAAGQAVGPVLSGSVQGSAAVTAEQAVLLDADGTDGHDVTGEPNDAVVVVNDEGTSFTSGIETVVGENDVYLKLDIENASNDAANAVLELNVPAGIDVEVESSDSSDIAETQLSANSWLLEVVASKTNEETLNIQIEPKDDAKPGFYDISGRIVQIGG